jgi:hypothetical protein
MVSDDHAHEKLMQAVHALATGTGRIQERGAVSEAEGAR